MSVEIPWPVNSHQLYFYLNTGIYTYAVAIVVFALFFKMRFNGKSSLKQIPQKKLRPFSILGNYGDIPKGDAVFKNYPASVYFFQLITGYCHLFKNEQLVAFLMANKLHILLLKANAVESLMKSTSILKKSWTYNFLIPWLGTGLLISDKNKWRSRRKLLTPSFHFDILKHFLPVFNERSQVLVDILKTKTEEPWVDLHPIVTLCTLDIICESTLGVKVHAQQNSESEYIKSVLRISRIIVQRLMNPFLWYKWIFYNTQIGKQFKKDLEILHTFTKNVIQKKKELLESNADVQKSKRKALLDLLLEQNMEHKNLTDEDVREEIDTFVFEGHDTTSAGLTWSIYLMGLYPDIQTKVFEELEMIFGEDDRMATADDIREMKYLECVLKESQRLYPSVPIIERQLEEETTICGYSIPKGTVLTVNAFMLHRDETVFPNPEVFDPERFKLETLKNRHAFAYVPFSAGPRNCIGQKFAMMELKTVVSSILRKFSIESLDQRDKITYADELILRPTIPIKIKLSLRH